ncbi:hypothetical protein Hypma_009724 [Hypsizygus marmoreus]|uniref:Uncharacterized protein n=1 Tax=Hypsizygus marmoreus TaxID=39966 RepID=A0A369JLE5_HYPMA|nr:hypothetical protein Hypma_009724 [Hypsizygus marmoreus]
MATVGGAALVIPTLLQPNTSKTLPPITFAINDTFVFLAISWRLLMVAWFESKTRHDLRYVVLGKYLPAFFRALLQDGQGLGDEQHNCRHFNFPSSGLCIAMHCVLMNTMACRILAKLSSGTFERSLYLHGGSAHDHAYHLSVNTGRM